MQLRALRRKLAGDNVLPVGRSAAPSSTVPAEPVP
jgi:hypothetical protein